MAIFSYFGAKIHKCDKMWPRDMVEYEWGISYQYSKRREAQNWHTKNYLVG